jgi:H+-transporting ATPase
MDAAATPIADADADADADAAGLRAAEAAERLARFGPNAIEPAQESLLRRALAKLWAPVPWMLEAAVLLELALGKFAEGAIIAALLLFNAVLALLQEGRARTALAALRSCLAVNASVRRDGVWRTVAARELVPGDRVKLSLGAVVPADVRVRAGTVQVDHAMLTGESRPVQVAAGGSTWAGALVRGGEAEAVVTATGVRTRFGRTAELVQSAHAQGTQEKAVLRVVRNLALFNGVVILLLVVHAWRQGLPPTAIEPLVLTAFLASIPVSLPATFTMAAAVSAHVLARRGVLATRLSALDEAGSIDVLCADKTGTLTQNALRVVQVRAWQGLDEARLLQLAALAGSDGGADAVDAAIRVAAGPVPEMASRLAFAPFDPQTKRAEGVFVDATGRAQRVVKGAFAVIAGLAHADADAEPQRAAQALEEAGHRVLAVALGDAVGGASGGGVGRGPGDGSGEDPREDPREEPPLRLLGLIALGDPVREDAPALVAHLAEHGVRVMMVTGDAPATAAAVAAALGLRGAVRTPQAIAAGAVEAGCDVLAGVLPQHKFDLVRALQAQGHTVGMCGDGANDAPALRQAHMGIAVAQATDVAKAAAGLVLTTPGLAGVVDAIDEGRRAFRRVQTYALNSIVKKVATVLFIAAGFVITGQAVLTPLQMILLLLTGDLLSMALTTDRARASRQPSRWRIGRLSAAGVLIGLGQLAFALAVLMLAAEVLRLAPAALTTLSFLTLVLAGQATLYAIRARGPRGQAPPSRWLLAATAADLAIGIGVATSGLLGAALPWRLVLALLAAALGLMFALDALRRLAFARLGLN